MAVFSSPTLLPCLTAALYGPPIGLSGPVVRSTLLKVSILDLRSFSVLGLSLHAVVVHM
jgi:hypothetical protein